MGYCERNEDYYEPSEIEIILDEYKAKCKTVLLAEISGEIKALREENSNYKSKNAELYKKVICLDDLKRDIERTKSKLIQEGISEYQRKALSGIACGDTVWTIKVENKTIACPHCNGTNKIEVDVAGILQKVSCPHCNYSGKLVTDEKYLPVPRSIDEIKTQIWNSGKTFKREIYCKRAMDMADAYSDESDDGLIESNQGSNKVRRDFYLTEQECIEACKIKRDEWLESEKVVKK